MDGDIHIITITHTMVTAITHTTDIIITMVITTVQDIQTTITDIDLLWDQKLALIELTLIDVLQQEQMVL